MFAVMAVPLGLALNRIAREALTVSQVRSLLNARFGDDARVTQLEVAFDRDPITVRSVVIAPRARMQKTAPLQKAIEASLGRPVRLDIDQVLLEAGADDDAQREELRQAAPRPTLEAQRMTALARMIALITGVSADDVTIDRDHRRATAAAVPLPGATIATYRTLEARAAAETDGWSVAVVPPQGPLPAISFADNVDSLDAAGRAAVLTSAWAARRWNVPALAVPGLPLGDPPPRPNLTQRRAQAVAAALATQGVAAVAPAAASASRSRSPRRSDRRPRAHALRCGRDPDRARRRARLRQLSLPEAAIIDRLDGNGGDRVAAGRRDRSHPARRQLRGVDLVRFIAGIDCSTTLMDGMLSFLLFAGALHVDWHELRRGRWPIIVLSTIGVALSTALVGGGSCCCRTRSASICRRSWCFVSGALVGPGPDAIVGRRHAEAHCRRRWRRRSRAKVCSTMMVS
ncbi:cation:proton antiporter domain-containing protein [Sphingomonas sp. MMS24-JH45]